jgi:Leucine-rich repeat (LRR) protein
MLSAYSIYQLDNHLDNLVILVLYFNHLLDISSVIYALVASHSILGFVARIISNFKSESLIFLNNCSKFKSQIKIQLIGEIAHHNI